jgi:hypothetical protein
MEKQKITTGSGNGTPRSISEAVDVLLVGAAVSG